jgi:hypothetical protein
VPTRITLLKERLHVEEVVFVGDGGMVQAKGKAALTAAGIRYLTALSDPQVRRLLKRDVLQLELFAEQVCGVQADGKRYILRVWVQRHKLSSLVSLRLDERQITLTIDTAAQEHALQLAGCYVLETDIPAETLATQTAHDRYKDLTNVECDLRTLKTGLLEIRPLFVGR